MYRKYISVFIALFLVSVVAASVASAEPGDGISLGDAKLNLLGNVQEQYDSNVFLSSSDEKGDWISTFSPGAKLEWPFGSDNVFRAFYMADFNVYAEHDKQNSIDHTASAALEFNVNGVKMEFGDLFRKVYDRPDSETTERINRIINTASANISAEYGDLGYEAGYQNIVTYYLNDMYSHEDKDENFVNLIGTYRISADTKMLLEFDYGNINYTKTTNSDANLFQGLIGVRGKLTDSCSAEIKAGWQYRDYVRESDNNFNSIVTTASVREKFTQNDILELTWLRGPFESLYDGVNYYVANRIDATYTHKFTKKFSANAGGSFLWSWYPMETTEDGATKKREDGTWSVGGGVAYDIYKWLGWKAGYEFRQRHSNFGNFDFDDHLFTTSVSFVY